MNPICMSIYDDAGSEWHGRLHFKMTRLVIQFEFIYTVNEATSAYRGGCIEPMKGERLLDQWKVHNEMSKCFLKHAGNKGFSFRRRSDIGSLEAIHKNSISEQNDTRRSIFIFCKNLWQSHNFFACCRITWDGNVRKMKQKWPAGASQQNNPTTLEFCVNKTLYILNWYRCHSYPS